ncbi:2-methylcitrate dehydratase PrpD [Novosphingobium sp. CF614]|uniref:MmgE/PrpD family protein n=1 Tax=Novosphingobium sp. CF614 TaxID=1884364 RepID=UPI0008F41A60|nr:MmgE/PrpD family protein [Novosphingobium sp. CF614]SFF90090.1 2-methylcitrate dehydratase PrpD [Novosphingobium sp. CF614]
MTKSVTETLAEWVVSTRFDQVPELGVARVRERFIDSIGVAFAGMSVSTGQIMARWVREQGARGHCTVLGADFQTSASYAALTNAASGHALEFDDIAVGSGHYANPMTAATLALGEKLGASGADVILGWMVGYDIIAQTSKVTADPKGNSLLNRGWFNQGFLPAIGVAAAAARMMKFDVMQTRMAMGHAASTMAGVLKNRGSDTKGFVAGNAAMHGIMAAELVALGFTANDEIMDGEIGVGRLLGLDNGDPQKMLDGLGGWTMAKLGSTIRLHACCGASHWSQDALQKIVRKRPVQAGEIVRIDVEVPEFLLPMMPYEAPETGLEAKYSLQYDLATIALDGKAGLYQYTDAAVQRPEARALMKKVAVHPTNAGLASKVTVTLASGEVLEETVTKTHGNPADPLNREEVTGKFHECAEALVPLAQREQVIALCDRLEEVEDIRELGRALRVAEPVS